MHFYTNCFQYKNNIYYTGYEDNQRIKRKVQYEPYLFLPHQPGTVNPYRTLEGKFVTKKDFSSISEANQFIRDHRGIDNFKFYGNANFLYTWINDCFPGQMEYDSSLINIIFLDIEVESDKGLPDYRNAIHPITAITISKKGKKITFGCKSYKPKSPDVAYVPCKDEKDLLKRFLSVWNNPQYNPDVLTGWNVEGFDVPYLVNRIAKILGGEQAKKLSPWGIVEEREITSRFGDKTEIIYDIKGVSTLDYMQLYKKFSFKNQESLSLNFIANSELGEKKIDYSEYESLLHLYNQDYEKFIDYNIRDVELVEKLDDKLKLIEQVLALAYDGKVTYSDTLTTLRMWDTLIHNYLLDQYIVVPQPKHNREQELIGGYVKEPQIGMHNWVVSFDLTSLYPHLIIQYNIGPDTFVKKHGTSAVYNTPEKSIDAFLRREYKKEEFGDYAYTANLCAYRRDKQSFLAALMEKIYKDRDNYKKGMIEAKKAHENSEYSQETKEKLKKLIAQYDYLQMAKKIQLNSGYGAVANPYFRFYDHDNAEAVTASGQMAIRWIENRLNKAVNKLFRDSYPSDNQAKEKDYIIASDTDSLYVSFDDIVKKRWKGCSNEQIVTNINAACNHYFAPFIENCYKELADYTNAYKNVMQMKREVIASKGIWTAKKRYLLNVWDSEGVRYKEPQLKISGIESVRSSTPAACRDYIKKALNIIMNQDQKQLLDFIETCRDNFKNLPVEDISFPRSISGLNKYKDDASIYAKGTPIQVKGALIYNHIISKLGLDKTYPLIYNSDKIKFVYLKIPNPLHHTVISFVNAIPKQFKIADYIDYDTQFQKGFLEPVRTVVDAIGWQLERKANLEEWM